LLGSPADLREDAHVSNKDIGFRLELAAQLILHFAGFFRVAAEQDKARASFRELPGALVTNARGGPGDDASFSIKTRVSFILFLQAVLDVLQFVGK